MKNILLFIFGLFVFSLSFFACKKPPAETNIADYYAIDLRDETKTDIDLCFIDKDGSYAAFYLDQKNQNYAIHVGVSIEKPNSNDGYDIILDNNGYPQIVKSKDFIIYFSNFSDNTFDAAIDINGEIQYLWGIKSDIDFEKLLVKKSKIQKGGGLLDYTPQNWREFELLGATLLKFGVASVGIVTTAIVAPVPIIIGLGVVEIYSALTNDKIPKTVVGLGQLPFNPWNTALDFIVSFYADSWFDSIMTEIDEEIIESLKDFDYRPYQIQLSNYYIEMPFNPSETNIFVSTLSQWDIEQEDMGWCIAKKVNNNVIRIEVKESYTMGSRLATFMVCRNPSHEKVPCVYFTVEQIGIEYTISPTSLNFNATGGQSGFTVSVKSPATVESVDALDTWCQVSKNGVSPVNVIVKVDPNNNAARNTLVVVNFKLGESRVSTTVQVNQEGAVPSDWVLINGVKWATRNVSAPGTFAANPENPGMFYQWNKKVGWSATDPMINSNGGTTWDNSIPSGTTWEKANDPCPSGWRMPNNTELQSLVDANNQWTTINGVNGRVVGSGNNTIFLPAVGVRQYGILEDVGSNGWYWGSNSCDVDNYIYGMGLDNSNIYSDNCLPKNFGQSVRCVKE